MRMVAIGPAALLLVATPAAAAGVPPMDLARGELAVQAGVPAIGADLSLGRLVIGGAATGFAVPTLAYGYGVVGSLGWRLSGLPRREVCAGLALLGGTLSVSGAAGFGEAWFVQPALALAVPLGDAATLRLAGGPAFFLLTSRNAPASAQSRGFLPFVPNVELAFRLAEGSELTLGGLPSIVGWRGTF